MPALEVSTALDYPTLCVLCVVYIMSHQTPPDQHLHIPEVLTLQQPDEQHAPFLIVKVE